MASYLIDNLQRFETELVKKAAQHKLDKTCAFPYLQELVDEYQVVITNMFSKRTMGTSELNSIINIVLESAHPRSYIIEDFDVNEVDAFDSCLTDFGEALYHIIKYKPNVAYVAKGNLPKPRFFVEYYEPTKGGGVKTCTKSCTIDYIIQAISNKGKYALREEIKTLTKYK